ncbi:uncharacterized protein LOC111335162 isoform X2 [Stylophora pistillata]|uniref:uncharacterized protein LOC111335162 isoform X2 n=1 Tax=Stylophora pistillata TaxID=50429 RepID=UPI000C03AF11|nr:uncharacterized protein LOC111335162 isoform X2 [Stylophora pistillata]
MKSYILNKESERGRHKAQLGVCRIKILKEGESFRTVGSGCIVRGLRDECLWRERCCLVTNNKVLPAENFHLPECYMDFRKLNSTKIKTINLGNIAEPRASIHRPASGLVAILLKKPNVIWGNRSWRSVSTKRSFPKELNDERSNDFLCQVVDDANVNLFDVKSFTLTRGDREFVLKDGQLVYKSLFDFIGTSNRKPYGAVVLTRGENPKALGILTCSDDATSTILPLLFPDSQIRCLMPCAGEPAFLTSKEEKSAKVGQTITDSDSSKTLPNPGTSISTGAGSIMEAEPLSSRAMAEESNTQEICDKEEEFADPRASLDINDSKREAEGSVRNASELVQRAAQTAFSRSKRGEGDKERQPATEIMMNTGNDTHSVTQGAEKDNGEIKVRVSLKIDCCPVEKAEQKEGHLTAVNPDAIPDNLPTKVLAAIADRYLKYLKPTNREGFSEFLQYLIDVRKVIIVGLDFGSLIITVECRSLKILDELWKDYRTGYLAKMAQQYLVTDYILKKFELVDVKLTTTFDEENYRVARERALLLQSAGHVTVKKVLTAGALSVENKKESMTTEVFPSTDADTPNRTAQRARGSRKRGKAPENQDQKGIKKLHSAAKNGDVAAIDSLLLLGIGIDARDESGRTPLVTAILNGQLQAIKYLIGNGADPLKRSHGWNSLHWASFFGHTDVIEFLIRHVPDIDSRADQDMTPVLIATRYGKLQTVEFLISKGANLDLRDDRGWSSLHWASDINRTDIIELLVSHMTDTDPRDTKDRTPLMRAAWYGKLQAVECLIGLGANPSLEDDDGWNSLHWALLSDNTAVIDTMLSHGVSAESKTKKGDTPLMLARRYGVPNAITYLLRKSAKSD